MPMAMTAQRSHVSRSLAPVHSSRVAAPWLRATIVVLSAMAVLAMPKRAQSQATNYPSMQLPTASVRDYTAAVVSYSSAVRRLMQAVRAHRPEPPSDSGINLSAG